jgi:hypothetical protein
MAKQTNHLETVLEVEVPNGVTHAGFTPHENEILMGWVNGDNIERFLIEDTGLVKTEESLELKEIGDKRELDFNNGQSWLSFTYNYGPPGKGVVIAEVRLGEGDVRQLEQRAIWSHGNINNNSKSSVTSDGRYVAVAPGNNPLVILEKSEVEERRRKDHRTGFELEMICEGIPESECKNVAINSQGNLVAAYIEQRGKSYSSPSVKTLRVYSFNGNRLKEESRINVDKPITALTFNHDGTYLVSGTSKGINWDGSIGRYYPGQVIIYEKQRNRYKQVLSESMNEVSILNVDLNFNNDRVTILYQKERQTYLRIANVCIKGK